MFLLQVIVFFLDDFRYLSLVRFSHVSSDIRCIRVSDRLSRTLYLGQEIIQGIFQFWGHHFFALIRYQSCHASIV